MSSAPKRSPAAKDAAQTASDKRPEVRPAGKLPASRYVIYFAIAILGCAADLTTKQATFAWLGLPPHFVDPADPASFERWHGANRWWLIEGRLGIETSVNTGALFGMGSGYWWIFATLSIVAALGIMTWLFVFRAAQDRWLNVALAAVTAGILGNLFDRIGLWDATGLRAEYHHGVRDWILFVWPEIKLRIFNPWPNFNIADSLLVTGAIMLVVHAFVWREKSDETATVSRTRASPAKP